MIKKRKPMQRIGILWFICYISSFEACWSRNLREALKSRLGEYDFYWSVSCDMLNCIYYIKLRLPAKKGASTLVSVCLHKLLIKQLPPRHAERIITRVTFPCHGHNTLMFTSHIWHVLFLISHIQLCSVGKTVHSNKFIFYFM